MEQTEGDAMKKFEIRYDRRVSPDLLRHFEKEGVARSLVTYAKGAAYPLDLALRKNPKSGSEHVTLYTGLTAVLNVEQVKGQLRLKAHPTHASSKNGWDSSWSTLAHEEDWRERWADVELYLERVIPVATKTHGLTEGAVQAAVSSYGKDRRVMLDREVIPSFWDKETKQRILARCKEPLLKAVHSKDFKAGKVPTSFGAECDLLAVEEDGRLLAVEVKPARAGAIAWVAAQATMYALVLQEWIDGDPDLPPRNVIDGMLEQRTKLGLAPQMDVNLPERLQITPVVALQRGASQVHLDRMAAVSEAIAKLRLTVPAPEVYEVSITGRMERIA